MRFTLALAAVGSLALTGCDELAGCGNENPTLLLGEGASLEWVPLSDGDEVTIVQGIQGGYHVDAAGQIGPYRQEVTISGSLTVLDGKGGQPTEVAQAQPFNYFLVDYDDSTCTGEFYGAQVRLLQDFNNEMRIRQMLGRDATIEVTVTDLDGNDAVTESRTVRLAR